MSLQGRIKALEDALSIDTGLEPMLLTIKGQIETYNETIASIEEQEEILMSIEQTVMENTAAVAILDGDDMTEGSIAFLTA